MTQSLEYLIIIPCIIVGNSLAKKGKLVSATDKEEFEDLLNLYSTNPSMMREFSKTLSSTYLYPSSEERLELTKDEFIKILSDF